MAHFAARHLVILKPMAQRSLVALAASLMLSACAQFGEGDAPSLLAAAPPSPDSGVPAHTQTELEQATQYWGKEYAKNPRNLDSALSYAKNLKAMGQKSQALAVLQQASIYNGTDKKLASEYGRLALDQDQIQVAKQLLEVADDPTNPDWRVISARGTVFAKQGQYRDAIPYYERAMTLAQDKPSVLNNLALAYAMNGEPEKAEQMLRTASEKGGASAKVRQNLALVLGLQGKYDESKTVGSRDASPATAAANADYLKRIVKLEPKSSPAPQPAVAAVTQWPAPQTKTANAEQPADAVASGWNTQVAATAAASP